MPVVHTQILEIFYLIIGFSLNDGPVNYAKVSDQSEVTCHGSSFAVHAVTKDCSSEKGSFIFCTYIYIHEAHFTLSYNLI